MIMKKLIAFAVVFALVAAGGVFAADLGAEIIGTVTLFEGNNAEYSGIEGSFGMNRIRIQGDGENDDGTFGAWYRLDGVHWSGNPVFEGLAWWKPADMFKLAIGGNSDGQYGKEGYAGWMFKQRANDNGVVSADQAWGCDYSVGSMAMMSFWDYAWAADERDFLGDDWNDDWDITDPGDIQEIYGAIYGKLFSNKAVFRDAFYGGFGGQALMLEIKPVDMFGLNIILPYKDHGRGGYNWAEDKFIGGVSEVFKNMTIQMDLNLDFGNIALTFDLAPYNNGVDVASKVSGKLYLYFGLSAIDNLSLDVGVGFGLPKSYADGHLKRMDPIAFGVAAKYSISDAFGLKARVLAEFMGNWKMDGVDKPLNDPIALIAEVLPFFAINDSMTVFADIGINMVGATKYDGNKVADSGVGFHFNPYVQIGSEWGPSFFAGIKVWTTPTWDLFSTGDSIKTNKNVIKFAVPIALNVAF
jgi:hypothetical protein